MDRAEWPDRADSASPPLDFADVDVGAAPGPDAPAPAEPRSAAIAPARAGRAPVRVVGAPAYPDTTRQPAELALRRLSVAGVSRRRMGWIAGIVISFWIVAVFARQVGQASAAATRADQVRADNATLSAEVAALQHERDVVQERSFIEFQARAFGLGNALDQPFTLAANAPSLAPNAPGSASVRLTAVPAPQTPLNSWLALLFGPSR